MIAIHLVAVVLLLHLYLLFCPNRNRTLYCFIYCFSLSTFCDIYILISSHALSLSLAVITMLYLSASSYNEALSMPTGPFYVISLSGLRFMTCYYLNLSFWLHIVLFNVHISFPCHCNCQISPLRPEPHLLYSEPQLHSLSLITHSKI